MNSEVETLTLTKQLHVAIHADQMKEVKRLVEEGADMDHVLGMRGTALCESIESKNLEISRFLLESGCNVNARHYDGEPPLLLALRKDNPGHIRGRVPSLDIAKMLIFHPKCDINVTDPMTKKTAIHFVAEEGMVEVIQWLLKAPIKCKMEAKDANENTALHLAVLNGHHAIVDLLVNTSDCVLNIFNKAGLTPMHICAKNGDLESLKILMKKMKTAEGGGNACDINVTSYFEGNTCLQFASRCGHAEIVKVLVDNGADMNLRNSVGMTALMEAIVSPSQFKTKNNEIAKILLNRVANPNIKSIISCQYKRGDCYETPLLVATKGDNVELARLLVQHGADVNMPDDTGQTPLFTALWENSQNVAEYLVKECPKIDVCKPAYEGNTCLHAAVKCRSKKHPKTSAELVKAVIDAGAEIKQNDDKKTPIQIAYEHLNHTVLDVLLEHTADNPQTAAFLSQNALLISAVDECEGEIEIVKVLLGHGVDIDQRSPLSEHESGLSVALNASYLHIARYLVENGLDLRNEKYIYENYDENDEKNGSNNSGRRPYDDDDDDDDDNDDDDDDDDGKFSSDDDNGDDGYLRVSNVLQWLRNEAFNPRTLKMSCLVYVRKYFQQHNIKFQKIDSLPLPQPLRQKLRYRDG